MKSKWKVSSNYIGGAMEYQVVRVLDTDRIEHSGNREVHGIYQRAYDAELVAAMLNRKEQDNGEFMEVEE